MSTDSQLIWKECCGSYYHKPTCKLHRLYVDPITQTLIEKAMPKTLSTHVREAYKKTPQADLDRLLAERSRWQRKLTIAENKLALAQRQLDRLAQEHVTTLMGDQANESK